MAKTTPEGKVKQQVKDMLDYMGMIRAGKPYKTGATGWYYMPVQGTIGTGGIPDFIGHYKGRFFAIETKAPGKKPTVRQELNLSAIRGTGGDAFVVDGEWGGMTG